MTSDVIPSLQSLPGSTLIREQAGAVTAQYRNVAAENDQGTHFRPMARQNGKMVWQVWSFEPGSEYLTNRYIQNHGIRRQQ